jgi:hypothetical protein
MLKRIPYVIDNDKHKLGDVLNQVLAEHAELAMDVATAYFNIQGYAVLAEGLKGVGSLRLLLGGAGRQHADRRDAGPVCVKGRTAG